VEAGKWGKGNREFLALALLAKLFGEVFENLEVVVADRRPRPQQHDVKVALADGWNDDLLRETLVGKLLQRVPERKKRKLTIAIRVRCWTVSSFHFPNIWRFEG